MWDVVVVGAGGPALAAGVARGLVVTGVVVTRLVRLVVGHEPGLPRPAL